MAAAEQPLKKRKLYDPPPPSSPPPQQPPPPPSPPKEPPPQPPQPSTPPPLTHEEILRRRRCQEEIRNVFECFKRIRMYSDQKDERFKPELEEAYLSLITASGGHASCKYEDGFIGGAGAKRLAAEYIPRYASYCPTALDTAAKVVLNIHDWCFTVMSRGEDIDGLAFETANACILGLVDICQAAASGAPTSAVIQGISSAVFRSVFTFLVSSFEGKDVFDIVDQRVLKIYEVSESFLDFIHEFSEEDNTILVKLSKFRALSFLRIFLSFPKDSLAACFELFESTGMEGIQKGNQFLRQLTTELHDSGALDEGCDDEPSILSLRTECDEKHPNDQYPPPRCSSFSNSTLKNCLLRLVLTKDPSFKSWIVSRYRMFCDFASSEVVSDVTSFLEGVLESFVQQVKADDSQVDSFEGNSGSSRARTPRELLNRQSFSLSPRTPRDVRSTSFNARNHSAQMDRSPVPHIDLPSPNLRSSTGAANSPFESPSQNITPLPSSTNAIMYSDGDQAAMDIYPASKQLWVGSLGPDATEMLIRYQFEKFGFIDHLRYFPFKGFATVEYRNIMDALKAREVMRGRSPWGACLRIQFLDSALGTRGAVNGTAVGSSSHIYIGNVSSIWAKDEMMDEVKKILHRGPRMVFDLCREGALLIEFDSPEEATMILGHLRWHRKENSSVFRPPSSIGPANVMMHGDSGKAASVSVHVDMRNNFPSNNSIGSPHAQNMLEKPPESYVTRTSGLSVSLQQLRAKYNINHPKGALENHSPGSSMREQEWVPMNTLWINVPNNITSCITDDEVLTICNLATINTGSVLRLSRTNTPTTSYWFVECNSTDTANTLLRNLRDCPGNFFHIEFSSPETHLVTAPLLRPDSSSLELTSPRMGQGNSGPTMQTAQTYRSPWTSGGSEQSWMYGNPESGMHPRGSISSVHGQTPGPFAPTQPGQASTFIRPVYVPPPNRWDPRGLGHHPPPNQIPSNLQGPPFIPVSVTPQMQHGSSMAPFDQMFSLPVVAPPLSPLPPPPPNVAPPLPQSDFRTTLPPPHHELQPPLPPTPPPPLPPPPPPHVEPPAFPPPPSSSPSAAVDTSSRPSPQYPWQGILTKSGVHYCTIYAQRVDSDICNYSTAVAEPAEWPAKLDMTKRTDLRHVKSTFSSTPSQRRELCWLLPSSHGDHKGLQDFISYLKQRDCAGVIKIPAAKAMWARLLFILPYSPETCSMLSIPPNQSPCLIGLIVPKDTNSELA
ncbi:hypothetical protein CASFOL_001029 [Castilleja foliolosa]|uniref:RRM domain-containing protein n=1 Tax=Castilleja foliolosa TaxID=1961234 RepID=A0ABD3ELF5_9LAMI